MGPRKHGTIHRPHAPNLRGADGDYKHTGGIATPARAISSSEVSRLSVRSAGFSPFLPDNGPDHGGLIKVGGYLYGLATMGGEDRDGTLYKILPVAETN